MQEKLSTLVIAGILGAVVILLIVIGYLVLRPASQASGNSNGTSNPPPMARRGSAQQGNGTP